MAKSYHNRYNQRCDRGRGEEGGIFGAVTDDSTLKSHIRETEGERKRGKEKTIKPGPRPQAAISPGGHQINASLAGAVGGLLYRCLKGRRDKERSCEG